MEFTRRLQGGGSFRLKKKKKKKAGRERVRQKLYRKRSDSFGGEGRGEGGGVKIRISFFGGFQKGVFRHQAEKLYPSDGNAEAVGAT